MTARSRLAAWMLGPVMLAAPGCAYHLAGGAAIGFLPEHVRVLLILPFENRTTRPEIEQRITEEVTRQFAQRGRYSLTTKRSEADAMLQGAVTSYRTAPVRFSDAGLATRVEAVVTLQATLRELPNDNVLWSQSDLLFREQFDVPEGGEFFDQESLALEQIARGVSGALVTSILEGF
jgi:hypothetical protein